MKPLLSVDDEAEEGARPWRDSMPRGEGKKEVEGGEELLLRGKGEERCRWGRGHGVGAGQEVGDTVGVGVGVSACSTRLGTGPRERCGASCERHARGHEGGGALPLWVGHGVRRQGGCLGLSGSEVQRASMVGRWERVLERG